MTTVANGRCTSAPAHVDNAIGTNPRLCDERRHKHWYWLRRPPRPLLRGSLWIRTAVDMYIDWTAHNIRLIEPSSSTFKVFHRLIVGRSQQIRGILVELRRKPVCVLRHDETSDQLLFSQTVLLLDCIDNIGHQALQRTGRVLSGVVGLTGALRCPNVSIFPRNDDNDRHAQADPSHRYGNRKLHQCGEDTPFPH